MSGNQGFDAISPFRVHASSGMPRYETTNEPAPQPGHVSSEPAAAGAPRPTTGNVAPDDASTVRAPSTETDDTVGADFEHIDSDVATPPAPSGPGSQADSTPADIMTLSLLTLSPAEGSPSAAAGQLTLSNLHMLELMSRPANPILLFSQDPSPDPSTALYMERGSDSPTIADDWLMPVTDDSQPTEMFGIGYWADIACPLSV